MEKANALFRRFKFYTEKENFDTVVEAIESGKTFRGTNLWILIFAIFIACLGLNVNSPAVVIGAMLISPVMGPIMGMGFGLSISDLALFRSSFLNYSFAVIAGLLASTLYFLVSPINDAHSELLARTQPTVYDVLIALFGGFAGIVAATSKHKGNVVPGVAIATALIPPLCTAGYGLATWQMKFFIGAFYLFIINTVFIGLATLITTRLLRFPRKHLVDEKADARASRIVTVVVILTLVPSIYLGIDLVQQQRFIKAANTFIEKETRLPNDYLLKQEVDPKTQVVELTYGGQKITDSQLVSLQNKLNRYYLPAAKLVVHQGFAYLAERKTKETTEEELRLTALNLEMDKLAKENSLLKTTLQKADSLKKKQANAVRQFYKEMRVQYPTLVSASIQPLEMLTDTGRTAASHLVLLNFSRKPSLTDRRRISRWVQAHFNSTAIKLIFE